MPTRVTYKKNTGLPGITEIGPNRFRWRARWTCKKTGKRKKREGVTATIEEAVVAQRRARGREPDVKRTPVRFKDYAMRWLQESHRRWAESTRDRYMRELTHLILGLGDHFVHTIEPADIRAWRASGERDFAPRTLNGRLRVLRTCLDDAVVDGILRSNPAKPVKALREKRTTGKRAVAWTADEYRRVLAVLHEGDVVAKDIGRMIEVLMWTGIRKGELLALRFEDVGDRELHVRRSVFRRVEGTTKTDDPRVVALAEPLRDAIARQRRWLLQTQHPGLDSGLVFPASPRHARGGANRRGADALSWHRSPSCLDKPLARVCEAAGVRPVTPHALRRSFERMLREAGVDKLQRRAMLGWRSESAQEIYTEVDADEMARGAERVAEFVASGTP